MRFSLKSNRETIKEGMKLSNKSKQMTEKRPFVEVATDAWSPVSSQATMSSLSDMKHLLTKADGSGRRPSLLSGQPENRRPPMALPFCQDASLILTQRGRAAGQNLAE